MAHLLLRKLGHFIGYAILCLLIFRGLQASFKRAWSPAVAGGVAVVATFAVACLDEWHQSLLPSRTGVFRDVMLDSAGAIALQAITVIIFWRRRSVPLLNQQN